MTTKISCDCCHTHLGWMNDCGPRGWIYCDSCKEKRDKEEEENQEEE